jgi:hypothetical protein
LKLKDFQTESLKEWVVTILLISPVWSLWLTTAESHLGADAAATEAALGVAKDAYHGSPWYFGCGVTPVVSQLMLPNQVFAKAQATIAR